MGFNLMEKLLKILTLFFLFVVGFTLFFPATAQAQINSLGTATVLPVTDKKIEDGDIIIYTDKGYSKSGIAYDSRMVGVVTLNPAITLKSESGQKGTPVISNGIAYVKVTDTNGNIKKGDFLTSSPVAGTGMKADASGFIIGQALDDASFSAGQTKLIQVAVNPHYTASSVSLSSNFLDIFKIGKLAATEKPSKILQYIIAGIITIVTFGAGFLIFAKTVNTGMEAMGRNPLAGRMIQLSIIFNIVLIIVILIAGTGLAYLVLRL